MEAIGAEEDCAEGPPPAILARTSRLMMRPPGPEPVSSEGDSILFGDSSSHRTDLDTATRGCHWSRWSRNRCWGRGCWNGRHVLNWRRRGSRRRSRSFGSGIDRRSGLGRSVRSGRRGISDGGFSGLAILREHGDGGPDRNLLARFDEKTSDHAIVESLHFHGRLVRFDIGKDVSGGDFISDTDVPLDDGASFHGVESRGIVTSMDIGS